MHKIIHLYKRTADTTPEEFHRRLISICEKDPEIPNLSQYVQSHALLQGYRKGELIFDGVEEFSFRASDIAAEFLASQIYQLICDRRKVVTDVSKSATMMVDVHRVKDGPVPREAVKNIEFVNRRPTLNLPEFRRYWRDVHGPIAAKIPSILRYEQNHTSLDAYLGGVAPRFDGLAITWFESTAAMRKGAATPEYETTRIDEPNFLPDGHLPIIITREVAERRASSFI
ncbi:EthD family reductase [Bradyrhizobium sp.]|uniref:EthD family reductase n=1 Tax=Bradyrhizobium sp. TaxID=376 RepID=UPI003C76BD05